MLFSDFRVRWKSPMPKHILWFFLCFAAAMEQTSSAFATAAPKPTFPVLTYSTYLRDAFTPTAVAVDSSGNIYLAGNAIVDPSTEQATALLVKLNPQATEYLYVRYLGGSLFDSARAIAVDSVGNAYVAGTTASPDFPVTSGGNLGTAPTGINDRRSFIAKFDPNGELLFSDLVGGSAFSDVQAVAVNASGQVIVSGVSYTSGFPSTPGAYSVSDSSNGHLYLVELDPTGTKLVFSATGIGGSSVVVDAAGDIYVAGTTFLLDYPTTPGAYQTQFPAFLDFIPPGFGGFQGANQYVTKVDPTGSKLIYSTSVSGTYNTSNAGMAVDSAGDVYLTGVAAGTYPYTLPVPSLPALSNEPGVLPALPFLTKLDPTGSKLLFSAPAGGFGVQVDSNGNAYAGGMVGHLPGPALGYFVASNLPALASVPSQCLPNAQIPNLSFVSQVDTGTGRLLATQLIGGSTLSIADIAISGSTIWATGGVSLPNFPFSPNSLTLPNFLPGPLPGAFLGAVGFTQSAPPAGTPQIACIADAADLALAGPVAQSQLFTIFGSGLGPAKGVSVTNYTTGVLAGVDVSFGSTPSPLLYVSATQINFAVPADLPSSAANNMKVTVNGVSSPALQLPLTYANPSLFLAGPPPASNDTSFPLEALVLNADGSQNSSTNPATASSVISVFVNGLSPSSGIVEQPPQLISDNGWVVTNFAASNPFVLQVQLQVPAKLVGNFGCTPDISSCFTQFDIYVGESGLEVSGTVYVTKVKT